MLDNSILVLNGKGGVLKTSVTANLAGLAALTGWRVLGVDLDPQGNLSRDLGYTDQSDGGAELAAAVRQRRAPRPLKDIRANLDILPGGPALHDLLADLQRSLLQGQLSAADGVGETLAGVAEHYDLVLIDSPPGEALLHAAAIRATHYILIPTKADAASIDGLGRVAEVVAREGGSNPELEVLGVVVGPLPVQARALARETRLELAELLGPGITIFDTTIRDAPRAAVDCRRLGVLAHEYETAALNAPKWWTTRKKDGNTERYSEAATGLASDYQNLAKAVLARYTARQTTISHRRTGTDG